MGGWRRGRRGGRSRGEHVKLGERQRARRITHELERDIVAAQLAVACKTEWPSTRWHLDGLRATAAPRVLAAEIPKCSTTPELKPRQQVLMPGVGCIVDDDVEARRDAAACQTYGQPIARPHRSFAKRIGVVIDAL